MPSDPIELLADPLVARILRSRGGQRLLEMGPDEMQQFVSSAEPSLTISSSQDDAVKASIDDARKGPQPRCDVAMWGGGIPTSLAFVGAATILEERGYTFVRLAGASAGALVGALLASGYAPAEIREILFALDYRQLLGRPPSQILNLGSRSRAKYSLDFFSDWIHHFLSQKGVRTFGDLRLADSNSAQPRDERYKFVAVVADLSIGELVRLPSAYRSYGWDPDKQLVAHALVAAVADPALFTDITIEVAHGRRQLGDASALDPWVTGLFDRGDGAPPRWPTFGVRVAPYDEPHGAEAATEDDQRDLARTIVISGPLSSSFELSREQALALYDSGRRAAETFLRDWDWSRYVETYWIHSD
jgi:NTE family protein